MDEFKKIHRTLRIIIFLIVILFGLLTAVLVHQSHSPKTTSFPNVQVANGKDGISPQIDYGKIYTYIQQQVAQIAVPHNGVNGVNGQSITGPAGASIQGIQGVAGIGTSGAQGEPGSPGKEIELRHNDTKAQTEWRYTGDLTWVLLFKDCQILNTCVVL